MPLFEDPLENPFLFDLYMEGKAQGRAEALAEERLARHRDIWERGIARILEHRFGALPEWAREKIKSTPTDQLENLTDRAMDAPDLDSALNS